MVCCLASLKPVSQGTLWMPVLLLGGDIVQKPSIEPFQLKAGDDKYICSTHRSLCDGKRCASLSSE